MDTLIASQSETIIKPIVVNDNKYTGSDRNDKGLVMNHNDSDSNEFDNLFREYYRSLRAYAFRYVNDLFVAEDIVQDVFLKLWEKRNKLDQIISIRSYLFTSVFNGVHNFLKHKNVETIYEEKQGKAFREIELYYLQCIGDSADSLITKELDGQIKEAINDLPEQCKNVFILSRYYGLKNREIADKIGVTIKAVEKQITKALQILRIELKDYIALIFCLIKILNLFS